MEDFYATLECQENATGIEIKDAYQRLSLLYHPGKWWITNNVIFYHLCIFSRIFDSSYVRSCGRDFKMAV